MRNIGIEAKIIRMIESLYKESKCAVVIDGMLTDWFKVECGVRQGCLLSPTLFNIFLEHVMTEVKSLDSVFQLSDHVSADLRYADDTTLLSTIFQKLKLSTAELETACQRWGMKINGAKCKLMSPSNDSLSIDGLQVGSVEEFVFLGSVVPGTSSDIKRRIALASQAFGRLRASIWSERRISKAMKVRIYKALILPIATYASETWTLKSEDIDKLEVFEMRCLRAILGISTIQRLRNTAIRKTLNITNTISEVITQRRLKWFGHVVRRPDENYVSKAFRQDLQGRRSRGRPRKRWSDQIRSDTGLPLRTAERRAYDREGWRRECRKVGARGDPRLRQ